MRKKILRFALKAAAAVLSFLLILCLLQPFFVPKFIRTNSESTVLVNGFRQLEENSVDVLFLGSSQMFRSVDTVRLYEEYGVSAYNYGASGQSMSITPYYFTEALKTQSPKLVMVEVGRFFITNAELTENEIAWNYAPTPLTKEKLASLEQTLGSRGKAYTYAFFPLFTFHDRWRKLGDTADDDGRYDIDYVLHPEKYNGLYPRGFVDCDYVHPQDYDYYSTDTSAPEPPAESAAAVDELVSLCRERNIRLVFFKTPTPYWSRGESEAVRRFLETRGLDYLELNEYAAEIGIDNETDFSDIRHLNTYGARKVTDYLAKLLPSYY